LRILHLSHGTLPDWRIEKCALSASTKRGYETTFAGLAPVVTHTKANSFSKIYKIDWTEGAKFGIPFYWHSVKKQLSIILEESRPDIVHAHNIFAAKMVSEFGIPFVYDDHEYTSVYVRGLTERIKESSYFFALKKINSRFLSRSFKKAVWNVLLRHRAKRLWTKWERELLSLSEPTIVTTKKVAEDLRSRYGNSNTDRIFVVPNLPMESEAQSFGNPVYHDKVSSVYAGADRFYSAGIYAHRNLEGLADLFLNYDLGDLVLIGVNNPKSDSSPKIKYMEFLPRQCMYNEMFKHSLGLMAFKKHWSHPFKSPNKAYEYAHAGLFVMCTSSFTSVIDSFKGNCGVFEDYNDLASQLRNYRDNPEDLFKKRLKSFDHARKNLVWEKYEENIFKAYQLA
jgi:glycosyltransferase involved in cell wall biosynthesis